VIDVWLVRHGEVASYMGDQGLTAHGRAQSRAAAAELADEVAGPVALRHAPSRRARDTADALGAALREHGVAVEDAGVDAGFENLRSIVDGIPRPHDRMRPALRSIRGDDDAALPAWAREVARFVDIHDGSGDPIEWWLKQPTLALEPASVVVRRFWRALRRVAAGAAPRTVVCTHSGPMRALAAHAIGLDPGEPLHLERVRVHLDGDRAEVAYRGQRIRLAIPDTEEPAWS
jgi:broad specificity phosphatase PhoE